MFACKFYKVLAFLFLLMLDDMQLSHFISSMSFSAVAVVTHIGTDMGCSKKIMLANKKYITTHLMAR